MRDVEGKARTVKELLKDVKVFNRFLPEGIQVGGEAGQGAGG